MFSPDIQGLALPTRESHRPCGSGRVFPTRSTHRPSRPIDLAAWRLAKPYARHTVAFVSFFDPLLNPQHVLKAGGGSDNPIIGRNGLHFGHRRATKSKCSNGSGTKELWPVGMSSEGSAPTSLAHENERRTSREEPVQKLYLEPARRNVNVTRSTQTEEMR